MVCEVIEPNKIKTRNWGKIRPRDIIINSALVPESFNDNEIEIYKEMLTHQKLPL